MGTYKEILDVVLHNIKESLPCDDVFYCDYSPCSNETEDLCDLAKYIERELKYMKVDKREKDE
jgi:hypothetical protein